MCKLVFVVLVLKHMVWRQCFCLDIICFLLGSLIGVFCIFILQIKQEISIMKLVRHPYVVRLHEACAKTSANDLQFSEICFLFHF